MHIGDTSLGGSRADFPETVLDVVRRAVHVSPDVQRLGLEELCRSYWKPTYHYFRVAWTKSNEDAKDLTQAFFVWLADPKVLKRYDPQRAGFRTFLKSLLRHFVQHHDEALGRLKRGGGRVMLNADVGKDLPSSIPGPEAAFEADWRKGVIDQAVEEVRDRLAGDSKSVKFKVFELYYLGTTAVQPTYDELARRFGLKASEIQHHLADVRDEVRKQIRSQLAETASGAQELQEEWNAFFGA